MKKQILKVILTGLSFIPIIILLVELAPTPEIWSPFSALLFVSLTVADEFGPIFLGTIVPVLLFYIATIRFLSGKTGVSDYFIIIAIITGVLNALMIYTSWYYGLTSGHLIRTQEKSIIA